MDDTNRDVQQILLNVKNATMFMDPVMKLMGVGTIMMITFLARMVKEKLLDKKEFKTVQDFMKATDGKYFIVNVPMTGGWLGADSMDKDLDNLRKLGVQYKIMPDLNQDDGFLQLMVSDDHKELFQGWYERYLYSKMQGGEMQLQNLKNLTGNKTSIISVPLEGKEQLFQSDFEKLGINYSILPDLKVGDGEIQIVVANADMNKVEHWYKLYQQDMLKEGVEVPDLNQIDMQTYTNTGEMNEAEYVGTANDVMKEADKKYEREPGELENSVMNKENVMKSENNPEYLKYESDANYQKFTIDRETLAEKGSATTKISDSMSERGFFASRVPGTYGKNEQILLVNKEDVFLSADQKTYTVFLDKNNKPLMLDSNFNLIPSDKRLNAKSLYNQHYDQFSKNQKQKPIFKNPEKSILPDKMPKVPVK